MDPDEECCKGKVVDKGKCCEGRETNDVNESRPGFCCGGQVIPPGKICCNSVIRVAELCCFGANGIRNPRNTGEECCNGDAYNPKTHVCCENKVKLIEECCNGEILKAGFVCCENKPKPEKECCNGAILQAGEVCCENKPKLEKECCNGAILQAGEVCCEGEPRPPGRCCGGRKVPEGEVCCGGKIVIPELCCFGPDMVGRPKTPEQGCCNGVVFDPKTEECCGDKVPKPDEACCNGKIYKREIETCCGGEVVLNGYCCQGVPVRPGEACCAGMIYRPAKEACCDVRGDGCSKMPTIFSANLSYTVVLDRSGNAWKGYPILEFEITGGCPRHYFDIQVSRKDATGLTAGPGIPGSWDKSQPPKYRVPVRTFSSWTNGERMLRFDHSGKATYRMPLAWWQDLARLSINEFSMPSRPGEMKLYYKVVTFCDTKIPPVSSLTQSVTVINNLKSFKLEDDKGYINFGIEKYIKMEFSVREAGTTGMYSFVQWFRGSVRGWTKGTKAMSYGTADLYGFLHQDNNPDWTIDRKGTGNPKYWNGNYYISADRKTAWADDRPGFHEHSMDNFSHRYYSCDFETRLHLSFDIPERLLVIRRDRNPAPPPPFGVITGIIPEPEPMILANEFWKVRILTEDNPPGYTVSHPDKFSGP